MDILLYTNAYPPQDCPSSRGVAKVVDDLRNISPRALVVAPALLSYTSGSPWELRIPLQRVTQGRPIFAPGEIPEGFEPEIVHSFDPFLTGALALRFAVQKDLPLVFSPSLLYPGRIEDLVDIPKHLAPLTDALATRYAQQSDLVVPGSEAIREELLRRRLDPIQETLPIGVDKRFSKFRGSEQNRPLRSAPSKASTAQMLTHKYQRTLQQCNRHPGKNPPRDLPRQLALVTEVMVPTWEALDRRSMKLQVKAA